MPSGTLTLLDLAARSDSDAVIGLVEDVITLAPEVEMFPALPKKGVTYMVTRRTSLPPAAFAAVNGGSPLGKSTYVKEVKSMHFLDCPLRVPESIYKADDRDLGDVLADEANGAVQSGFITLGKQIYYGTTADANGYVGLQSLIQGDTTLEVDAGGIAASATDCTSAYLIRLENQGVSLAVGKDGMLNFKPWIEQQVITGGTFANPQVAMAMCSNFSGYFGLTVASQYSVWRVKGIDATHPLTDKLGAQVLSLIPPQFRRSLRWFMNPVAQYTLQTARTAVGYQPAGSTGNPGFAPAPTELAGQPISITNQLVNTETT